MSKNYRFGTVGVGMIAEIHATAIGAIPNATLVGACGRDSERTAAFCRKLSCDPYTEVAALLEQDLDFLTIATPSGSHLEPVMAAAEAGVHVLVEKPLEVTVERIDAMLEKCREGGIRLFAILPRRFVPSVSILKTAIDEGHFGRIALADADIKWWRTQEYYESGAWRGTWKQDGGGALMNQSIHFIDLLLHLAGPVRAVCAFTGLVAHEDIEVEDVGVAILEFESGARGVIQGSTACWSGTGHPGEIQICGDGGSAFMTDNAFSNWEFKDGYLPDEAAAMIGGEEQVAMSAADPNAMTDEQHRLNFLEAIDAVENNRPSSVEGDEGRRAVELITSIYRSAENGGQRVELAAAGQS